MAEQAYQTDRNGLIYAIQTTCTLLVDKLQRRSLPGHRESPPCLNRCLDVLGYAMDGDPAALAELNAMVPLLRGGWRDVATDIELIVSCLKKWFPQYELASAPVGGS